MTPTEFLDGLLVHYGKRHASPEAEKIWHRDMIAVVKGTDHAVLARAYALIRDEHEERAFPLPATIRRFVGRACEQVFSEGRHRGPPPPEPVQHSAESRARVRDLLESFRREQAHRQLPATKVAALPDVSRDGFRAMQRSSRTGLLIDHAALSRRITGERSE